MLAWVRNFAEICILNCAVGIENIAKFSSRQSIN